jgi:cellulose synthase/poly-beta-1,6-N-acetylglucosamine synthase-like glycosyltransferase
MTAWEILFWVLFGVIFYAYVGYGALLQLLQFFKRPAKLQTMEALPPVTLLIASYNEASILPQKIANCLALDYPSEKLTVLVVTDGSTDGSPTLLKDFPGVQILHESTRRGKTAAINRAMETVTSPIVIFSDANALLNRNCLKKLVRHFQDPKVGAVAGEKKVAFASGMGSAEGWYWKYESFMKRLDASFYTVVGAAGELFAMRQSLFSPPPEDTLLDDFALSMQVCLQGFIIAYEPDAFATEAPSASLYNEQQRKMRIAAGAFQSLKRLSWRRLFSIPSLAFQFLSRRWLRWVVCPVGLVLLFLTNAFLAVCSTSFFYEALFALHLLFYGLACIGWWLIRRNKAFALVTVPFYFLFMNYCILAGYFQFLNGAHTVLWKKAERMDSGLSN